MTNHPTAITPEGHRIGAGMAEWLHSVYGPLDDEPETAFGLCECESNPCRCDESAVCQHGRDDYCRLCLVRERADERYLGDGGRFGWAARDELLGRMAE